VKLHKECQENWRNFQETVSAAPGSRLNSKTFWFWIGMSKSMADGMNGTEKASGIVIKMANY